MARNLDQANALDAGSTTQLKRARLENWVVVATLILASSFTVTDLLGDIGEGATLMHLIGEGVVAALSLIGAVVLWKRNTGLQREISEQKKLTERAESDRQLAIQESEKWKTEAAQVLRGLSDAIDLQLTRWQLTTAEKEVALLLLKGLSLKEVADVRHVSEKTARAQSFSIYSKSGLSGRAELSAFFLEDLMLPQTSLGN